MVSNEFLTGYLSAVYERVLGLGSFEGTSECSGLVWCRIALLENLQKAKLHTHGIFETSKYKNLPT